MPGAVCPRHSSRYDGTMSESPKGKAVKSSIGVLGALATIISVWWFALRPKFKKPHEE